MSLLLEEASDALQRGISACRQGRWREGLTLLTPLGQRFEGQGRLPALFYGYLGHAMVRCEGRKRDGLELCRHAVEKDPFQPESHLNLATVLLIIGNRRKALRALQAGLKIDPDHAPSLELMSRIGHRRSPPLPFLSRGNLLNYWLGKMTWWMKTQREEAALLREEEREERELDRKL